MDSATEPLKIDDHPTYRIDAALRILGSVLVTAIGILMLGKLFYYCRAGFDFTDGAYYLNSVEWPEMQKVCVSNFGQVLAPLWWATGKNLIHYRYAGVLIMQLLGFALAWVLLRRSRGDASWLTWFAITFGAATMANTFFFLYYPTPGYNMLSLCALLITAVGIALAPKAGSPASLRDSAASWLIIGAGGALAFLAKPTTAAALAVFTLLYLIFSGRLRWAPLFGAIGTSLLILLLFAWAVHGSPKQFVEDFLEGAKDLQIMGTHAEFIFRLHAPPMETRDIIISLAVIACCAIGVVVSAFRSRFIVNLDRSPLSRSLSRTIWFSLLAACGYLATVMFLRSTQWPARWSNTGLGTLFIALGAVVGALLSWRHLRSSGIKKDTWLTAGLLIVLPYAWVLGTNNNYCLFMQMAGVFWLFAGIVLLSDLAPSRMVHCALIFLVAAGQVFVMAGVEKAISFAPEQGELQSADSTIQVGPKKVTILVRPRQARIINNLQAIAAQGGFKPGMGLLDLTGRFPGAVFVLGAKPIGNAWVFGAKRYGFETAQRFLDRAGRDAIRTAWILMEPHGKLSYPKSILERYQLSLDKDYVPAGMTGPFEFFLYRPKTEPVSGL